MQNKEADYRWMWMEAKRRLQLIVRDSERQSAEHVTEKVSIAGATLYPHEARDILEMVFYPLEQENYFGAGWADEYLEIREEPI